jgi:hypothetical protein
MPRINLPSEKRLKSVDTSIETPDTFENTDIVVDQTAGKVLISDTVNWTKILSSDSIKVTASPDIADYDAGDLVFDTFTDEIKYKANGGDSEWTRLQNKDHITPIDTSTVSAEDYETNDIVIDTSDGSIKKVVGNTGSKYFYPLNLKGVLKQFTNPTIGDFGPGDVVLTDDLKLLRKAFQNSTDWIEIADLGINSLEPVKFSIMTTPTNTSGYKYDPADASAAPVSSGPRTLFPHSRGYLPGNTGPSIDLDQLQTYKETQVIDENVEVIWDNGRSLDLQRMAYVVGRRVFPEATIYNRTKDSAYTISFTKLPTTAVRFAYEYNGNYIICSDEVGVFLRDGHENPDNSGEIIVRPTANNPNKYWFVARLFDPANQTLFVSEAQADAGNAATPGAEPYVIVDSVTRLPVIDPNTDAIAQMTDLVNGGTVDTTDAVFFGYKEAYPIVARLDWDDGTNNLHSEITIGYRQKAIVTTMPANEANKWGYDIGIAPYISEFDASSCIFLVSVESI